MKLLIDHRDNASTVVKTLSPEQLSELDLAIVTRRPPTFTACYEQFELRDLGLSFDAFYRYARRLRTSLRAAALTQHNVPDPETSETILAQLVGQRIVEALMTEQVAPRSLHRLADAYRMTAQIEIQRRRLDIAEEVGIHRIAAAADQHPQLLASPPESPSSETQIALHDNSAPATAHTTQTFDLPVPQ